MPGFDGTGPRGLGPMTGGGEGCCILKLPDGASQYPARSEVRLDRPVDKAGGRDLELVFLQREVQRIEALLDAIRARLKQIETTNTQHARVEH